MSSGRESSRPTSNTRILAEAAVMIALAVVLDALRLYTLPQGGSITVGEMVPLLFLALRRGTKIGVFAGAIFGIIDVYFEPFIYNPFQFLLDYPLAFGALGLAGFFSRRPLNWAPPVGVAVGLGGRFVCHFFSGMIFFASFAPAGENPALYSAIYNASYLLPGLIISEVVILALVRARAFSFGM
jgi:thiamine transporter